MAAFDLVETVRVRDKSVEGGSRIINKVDLTTNDVLIEDKPKKKLDTLESDLKESE